MDLRDYLRAIRRRWWLVAGSVVLALVAATLITVLTPPRYEASVQFFVSAQTNGGVTDAYQGDLFSQQRVASYVDLLTSDRLADMIVANGQTTGLTAGQVQARISARAVPNTVLLHASVTDGDRARALSLARDVAVQFAALVQVLETPAGSTVASVRVEVVAGPRLEAAAVAPRPARNGGLALVLGLLVGIGLAALREAMDTTVKDAAGLAEQVDGPVLATVPFDARARKAPLILAGAAGSTRAEALRQLRTNLQFVDVDRPVRTLVVTSAGPNEGKSTTACNLAIVFAEAGKRVLLVDADLRRPRLAEYLNLEGAVGLTNVLAGHVRIEVAVQQWSGDKVFVLPSGSIPPNPSELLGSRHMAELLHRLEERFDAIIIDTPPLLPVTDAAVLASTVDGVVLVSRCGKTTASQAKQAATSLKAVGARLLGCVLNMTPTRGADAYSNYDYSRPAKPSVRAVKATPATPAAPGEPAAPATRPPERVSAR
jgi:capsular exopolysaccharide synthesis family protein